MRHMEIIEKKRDAYDHLSDDFNEVDFSLALPPCETFVKAFRENISMKDQNVDISTGSAHIVVRSETLSHEAIENRVIQIVKKINDER